MQHTIAYGVKQLYTCVAVGAVHAADEKHLSADSNVVGEVKYSFTNLRKTGNCIAVCA